MVAAKPLPRFVPTLTEVVQPGTVVDLVVPAKAIDREALIEQVLAAVKPRLEQQLRRSLAQLVDEQIRLAAQQWHGEIETTVTSLVEQILEPKQPKRK